MLKHFSKKFSSFSTIKNLRRTLHEVDPEIESQILNEKQRQVDGINLIASENYCSNAAFTAAGSIMNNKYAQGYPGARYYGGTQFADNIELLSQQRALDLFRLKKDQWGVNVQAYSGSPANIAVYTGLLNPHDRIMSLDLPHGGHLSHGFQSHGKKISAVAKFFEVLPYHLNLETGLIDYQKLYDTAKIYRPKLIVAGTSAYSRVLDYKKFRQICDQVGAVLHADMAHVAGLVAAGLIQSPFEYADVVTTTTHKTLRGPKGALIFYKVGSYKDKKGNEIKYDYKNKIDSAVFPGLQGGPHLHNIAGFAVSLKQAMSSDFVEYQKQVLKNIQAACKKAKKDDYTIISGGSDIHYMLIDLRNKKLDGARLEAVLNNVNIYINKNTVPGDQSALIPSGIRVGGPAMTTRGCVEKDFQQIIQFLNRSCEITTKIKENTKGTKLKDFRSSIQKGVCSTDMESLRKQVTQFANQFQIPGGLF